MTAHLGLSSGEVNKILDMYENLFSLKEQKDFLRHFGNRVENVSNDLTEFKQVDIDFWKMMNKTEEGIPAIRTKVWYDVVDEAEGMLLKQDPRYLELLFQFRFKDNAAHWRHVNEMLFKDGKEYIGGHTAQNLRYSSGAEVASGNFEGKWIVVDEIPITEGITQNISISTFTIHPKGHIRFDAKQLLYRYPGLEIMPSQPNQLILNGKKVKAFDRDFKTIINPSWSEAKILQEHTFALYHKKNCRTIKSNGRRYNESFPQIEAVYFSTFSDGTPVKVIWKNYERQGSEIINDYYYFEIDGFLN